jgi:autoinducer 2-degrading protein
VKEPGIARFDVLQQADDPTRFLLVEVFRTPDAQVATLGIGPLPFWRDAVAPMMAEPRFAVKYGNVFPVDEDW